MNPVEVFLMIVIGGSILTFTTIIISNYIVKNSDKRLGIKNKKELLPLCACGCGNKTSPYFGDIYDKATDTWWTKLHYQKLLQGEIL